MRQRTAELTWCVLLLQVVDIMKTNVEKVLERDQKLSELDDRAGALRSTNNQSKYWNCALIPVDMELRIDIRNVHIDIQYLYWFRVL
jgi:hypothetical protein